ncbi:HD domain-containing protein [bacterium]|nr:HD domain-containing protein [bacterium]
MTKDQNTVLVGSSNGSAPVRNQRPPFSDPKVPGGIFTRVQADPEISQLIKLANEHLGVIGFTEHGLRHSNRVATYAGMLLRVLDHPEREVDLAMTAGYLHDIGNFIGRTNHGQTGAAMLYGLLQRFGMDVRELGVVLSAVGNHEEQYGQVLNNVCAAVVIADKSDVHRTRVRNYDPQNHDIHDQVNYAVTKCALWVDDDDTQQVQAQTGRAIHLELEVDTSIATVMDYFQIFLSRMDMCRGAAHYLGCSFKLEINDTELS